MRPGALGERGEVFHCAADRLLEGAFPDAELCADDLLGGGDVDRILVSRGVLIPVLPVVHVPLENLGYAPVEAGIGMGNKNASSQTLIWAVMKPPVSEYSG